MTSKPHDGPCIDVDPFIPTGICARCAGTEWETLPPEDRPQNQTEEPST